MMKSVKWTTVPFAFALVAGLVLATGLNAQDTTKAEARGGDQKKVQSRDRMHKADKGSGPGSCIKGASDCFAGSGKFGEMAFDMMKAKLQLTDEQVATLQPLHQAMVDAGKAYWTALQETLTEEQKAAARESIGKAIQARMDGPKGFEKKDRPGDPMRHARFGALKQLNLTEEQQTQIKAVFEGVRDEMQAIFPKFKDDPEAARAEMQALQATVDARIKDVLTAEQYEQYQANIKEAGDKFGMGRKRPGSDDESDTPGRHRRAQ